VEIALLMCVFAIAACGLVYELGAGALSSYLLGDSVFQFSTVIGAYLFAMGIGSWLSRYFDRQLPAHFLRIELIVAIAGGMMPAVLFLINAYAPASFLLILYVLVILVGILVGLEIPLVMRILQRRVQFKTLVSQVLTFDYLGALAVSIAFPVILIPQLGMIRTGLMFGIFNALVAVWTLWLFRYELRHLSSHIIACVVVLIALILGFALAGKITTLGEEKYYQDSIVFSATSPYQRIIVTNGTTGYRLFLNGNLQFSQRDEYRYHEALVHPVMAAFGSPHKIAVLGGGDGMAVRELLKYPSVESITLVELDPNMTRLFSEHPQLAQLNGGSLKSPKVHIVNIDAFKWLEQIDDYFDVIIVDFPDPTNFAIGKLYTDSFYALLGKRLSASGYAVIQATSPLIARQSFWIVAQTVESAQLTSTPYHVHVPSFGEWGFVIASHRPWRWPEQLPTGLRFLSVGTLPLMFDFPPDMARITSPINRLSNQVLVSTYGQEWGKVLGHN
jgi:spermidine synthase